MENVRRSLYAVFFFIAFWAIIALLAWLRVATAALRVWFWTVTSLLLVTEAFYIACAAVRPQKWRGARIRDFLSVLFPGLLAGTTYEYASWIVRHPNCSPTPLAMLLIYDTLVGFLYFRILAWPWLAWLLHLRSKPTLQWTDAPASAAGSSAV